MERIIKAIETKMADDECTIYLLKSEVESLKNKLANAEKTIETQAHTISELKGASNG